MRTTTRNDHPRCSRRGFLQAASIAAASAWSATAWGAERPEVTEARATSGDRVEPDWEQRPTVTVGPGKAHLVGADHRVLQAAVDYVAGLGGGTVKVLPGEYRLRNAVYLKSNVRILGSGQDAVLVKEPSVTTKLAADSDWFDSEITLADASGFELGDGVCLRTKNPHHGGTDVVKRTLIARSGSRFKLDRALRKNFWLQGETTVSSLFPILSGEEVSDVVLEDLVLDGNREENENLNGNYAGCIFCQDCSRITVRGLTARNYNGDGVSWQVCHDVMVERCYSHDNAGLGLHPGSGSQRPIMRDNRLERNSIGLFFCWGVKFGLVEGNTIDDNSRHGISIGHRDTNNLVERNTVRRSGQVGVLFRPERGKAFAPHRNSFRENRIEDSGSDEGIAIDVQGETESVTIDSNELIETRGAAKRTGIRLGPKTRDIHLVENRIEGFATEIADLREG
ncbi:MAG: right-handed parallel beta-helix repeat-containing protein [Planctomycetes bacterium]|nr:right-handed parallel beta-helix repeat-containing protein [Planctomycetota bacterium]